ncbi:uncharacterized protein TRAVEDRAFT_31017 [Trametes versicolor FP-101664 SS1]|uniref:uncharacterized protein n=1 Tax=Trametes versicolor (strain FP-101664) TaxID=717944 RepID=UPI0004621E50|nr:uncharacterized protein TRAVEDRAFT_31017 [Trametes versicolor FP-101664 SS1]EIW55210.1 hypothetical protein TRAVEDRAFT_31017 [Trametes versicolor FP-101664 SS1]
MVAQLAVPGQSPGSGPSRELLHPFSYAHSNASKGSDISIGVQSTSTTERSHRAHLDGPSHRPEARSTSRAAARGISRMAARAPSHTPSRATSRSRSRAPSPSPRRSHIDLPDVTRLAPTASQNTLAIPDLDTYPPTPDRLPPVPPALMEDKVWPILQLPRYDDCPTITPTRADWILPPVSLSFPLEDVPPEWVACTHPEGRLYFYHPRKRIYTDVDVRDLTLLAVLGAFEERLTDMIRAEQVVLPPDCELMLYLERRPISGGYNWLYYYADNTARSLFWVQELDIIDELPEVAGIKTLSNIRYEMESRYWIHCEMYPHNHSLSEDDWAELTGILTFSSIDAITSLTSTISYGADEVHRMLGLVKSAKALTKVDYATVAMARLLNLFYRQRFLNMYGQPYARLSPAQSVYNTKKHPRTPLIKIMSFFFWNAPAVHLRGLERIWVDGIIHLRPWTTFIGKLQNEWQEFVLYATVLLNANVAFLAIPSVDNGTDQLSAAQISSNISIVTSVGSILLGLLLIRQHRVKSKDTPIEAFWFLSARKHPTLGLETLAIIYSLPYALLMWGMVTFLLAFSFECFGTPDTVGVFIFAAAWSAIAILVCWCIFTGWESGETKLKDRLLAWRERLLPKKKTDEDDALAGGGPLSALSLNEKAPWLAKFFKHGIFPHSGDPPTTEMEERASSSV